MVDFRGASCKQVFLVQTASPNTSGYLAAINLSPCTSDIHYLSYCCIYHRRSNFIRNQNNQVCPAKSYASGIRKSTNNLDRNVYRAVLPPREGSLGLQASISTQLAQPRVEQSTFWPPVASRIQSRENRNRFKEGAAGHERAGSKDYRYFYASKSGGDDYNHQAVSAGSNIPRVPPNPEDNYNREALCLPQSARDAQPKSCQ